MYSVVRAEVEKYTNIQICNKMAFLCSLNISSCLGNLIPVDGKKNNTNNCTCQLKASYSLKIQISYQG